MGTGSDSTDQELPVTSASFGKQRRVSITTSRTTSAQCSSIQPLMDSYVDLELDPDHAYKVADHLRRCASCQSDKQNLEQLKTLLRTRVATCDPAAVDRLQTYLHTLCQQEQ